jgi:hypothetical protein
MIVTGSIWDYVETNDYLAVTCSCGGGPSASLWSDVTIEKIHEGDGERAGRRLTSKWCAIHGADYCAAVLGARRPARRPGRSLRWLGRPSAPTTCAPSS